MKGDRHNEERHNGVGEIDEPKEEVSITSKNGKLQMVAEILEFVYVGGGNLH